MAGSFFEEVPAGGDAYAMKSILHDWDDPEAAAILRVCRSAMADLARLLLVERIVGAANEDPRTKFSDLNMLVAPGGRERTIEEWRALLDASGFGLIGTTRTASGLWVIEAGVRPHGSDPSTLTRRRGGVTRVSRFRNDELPPTSWRRSLG